MSSIPEDGIQWIRLIACTGDWRRANAVGNALEIQDESPAPLSKYLGEIERFSRVALFLSDYYVIQLQRSNRNLLRNALELLSLSFSLSFCVILWLMKVFKRRKLLYLYTIRCIEHFH